MGNYSDNMASVQEEIFKCVVSGDLDAIKQCLQAEREDESQEKDYFSKKDEFGRSALLTAAMLGKSDIVRELVRGGAQVNEQTERGESWVQLFISYGILNEIGFCLSRTTYLFLYLLYLIYLLPISTYINTF